MPETTALIALRTIIVNVAAFLLVAIGAGYVSAWYAVEAGTRLSIRTSGPWVVWPAAGRPDADPYTRAHAARNGLLPLSSTLELIYRAKADSAGAGLHSSCDYVIVIDGFEGAWWSIAAYGPRGQLIPNAADRYAFNANTVMREPDGRAIITLARDARPGNWLPTGGTGRLNFLLTVHDVAGSDSAAARALPEIQKIACR